ncbi:MAG TPA: GDP-mannose 4,6-dehydratase [Vicinamibacteria bacterium]|nr:GDP-mannose 4,6-dehydratase [Vicinamibacteria bacterium]
MRALVTGAAGFVGRHLVAELLSRGHVLGGVVHPTDGGRGSLGPRIEVFAIDILDDAALEGAFQRFEPDAVFHLAAFSNPEGSWKEARRTLETNVIGAHNLLSAANESRRRPRVLLVGSAQQYGDVPPEEQPISEEREQKPLTPYAVSKTTQEILGRRAFWSGELPVYLTRSFNHTGPGQSDTYVASSFARQVAEVESGAREPSIRVGNLTARRDFTDVRDVAAAYAAIVERGEAGRPYNVCRGEAVAMGDVLSELVRQSRVPVQVVVDPERYHAVDAPLIVGDPKRLETDTGWSPRYSLSETLRDLLDDWRARLR